MGGDDIDGGVYGGGGPPPPSSVFAPPLNTVMGLLLFGTLTSGRRLRALHGGLCQITVWPY